MTDCSSKRVNALYIVRYEDLVLEPKATMMGLFAFLLGERDLTGTNAERRIDQVVAMGKKATISYNLKPTTGQLNIHEDKYSPELRKYVQEELTEMLHYFGYAKEEAGKEENPTGFFEFPRETNEERGQKNLEASFHGCFKGDNEMTLDYVCSANFDHRKHYTTHPRDCMPMFDEHDLTNV